MKRKSNKKFDPFKGFLFLIVLFCSYIGTAQLIAEISVTDATANETGVQQAQFQVDLVPNGLTTINPARTVNYSIGGTATGGPGADYTALTGTLVFQPGVYSQFINVTGINDDNIVEGTETVVVTLTSCVACVLNADPNKLTGSVNIIDNDVGTVSLNLTMPPFDNIATEGPGGDNGLFRITLDKPNGTSAPITVNYTITGTASASDYTLTGAVPLTFANDGSQVNRNLNVVPLNDAVAELDETVIITLNTATGPLFSASGSATITIIDDDCAAGASAPSRNATSSDVCDVASLNLNTLITGGVNGGPGGAAAPLRWSTVANPTTAGQLLANSTVTAGTYYGLYWDNASMCASPSTQVVVTINTSPNAGTSTNASRCNDNAFGPTSIDLDNTLTGADTGGTWAYISGGSGNPGLNATTGAVNFNGDPLGNYVFRYTLTGAGACANDSVNVTITVNDCDPCIAGDTAPVRDTSIPLEFCDMVDASISLDDYTNSTPPVGTQLRWALDENDPTNSFVTAAQVADPLPGTYYGFFYDATNDCASPLLEISIKVFTTPTITATSQNVSRCGAGTVTLTATVTGNPTINWYDAATGGSPVGTGANFTTPSISQSRSYWVEATENNCATDRVEVKVEIIPQPSAGTPTDTSSCSDPTYGNTVLNLNGQLAGADPGTWAFTSGPANVDPGNGDAVDFIARPDGIYVFTYTTTGAVAPCVNESASVTVSVSNCDTDDDGDGLFGGTEQALGTDPQNADTDGDGIQDGVEVGPDINNPLNGDGDEFIDALDSNILDSDNDGVVDQLDPANENPCIPSRENSICDFDQDDITDVEEIANGSDPDDPCSPNPDHPNCRPIDLEILKVVDNENAVVGDNVIFTVTVNNLDPTRTARSIIIGDLLDVGFEYVSNTVSSGSFDEATSEWSIPGLGPMASATLAMEVLILEGGPYSNTATLLSSLPEDETVANNEATAQVNINLPEGVDLVLEKTALSANPLINEMVIFTIKVTNQSVNGDTVNNIQVEDLIPSGVDSPFVYVSHEEAAGTQYDLVSGIWTIETLGLGQEAVLTIVVNVPIQGTFTNTARIIRSSPADANPNNNEMTVTVNVSKPNPAEVGFLFNQFSPNGDGTNDFLQINRTNPQTQQQVAISYNVQIFNRYGNLVFNGKNMTETEVWDGSWKGKEAPDGTYFYVMNINVGDGPQTKKGWIQLIR